MELCNLNSEKDIIKDIYTHNDCNSLLNKIHLLLNQGSEGEVFSLIESDFVLKKYRSFIVNNNFNIIYLDPNNYIRLPLEIYDKIIFDLFGTLKFSYDISEYLDINDFLRLVIDYLPEEDLENIVKNSIYFNKGDSEFIIGRIATNLYEQGLCINYIKTEDIKKCINNVYYDSSTRDITFYFDTLLLVEKADGDLNSYLTYYVRSMDDEYFNKTIKSILFQTLFGIVCLHEYCNIIHNDIFPRNILYKFIKNSTEYNSEIIKYADYFYYNIKGKKYNIPYCDIIVKITDFGLANKFGDINVFTHFLFKFSNTKIRYSELTDIMMFLIGFYEFFEKIGRLTENMVLWKELIYDMIVECFLENYRRYNLPEEENIIYFIKEKVTHGIGKTKSKTKSLDFLEKMYKYLEYKPQSIEHGAYLGKII